MSRNPPTRPIPGPGNESSTWTRPSQGLPPRLDRHHDTYANRFDAGGPYDEPDFTLNERGVYDEPGYAVDEPYEQGRRHPGDLQSNYVGRRTPDHAGYGLASENQPAPYDDSGTYRPTPYAPPLGDEGPDIDDQAGAVFGESRPDLDRPSAAGLGPKGYQRTDDRIADEINERLTFDPYLDPSDVEVTVEDRAVTLRGVVASLRDKHHAEDIVDAVRGVREITNHLRVRR